MRRQRQQKKITLQEPPPSPQDKPKLPPTQEPAAQECPCCHSKEFVKRGTRQKKFERAQLYLCHSCGKTFTAQSVKGKHYPLHIILESLNYYNLGYSFVQTASIINAKFGHAVTPATIAGWAGQFLPFCSYSRMRPYAVKQYTPRETIETTTMAHRQLYRFCYHRAKMNFILEEYKNHRLFPLKEYLDAVTTETPHQYFQDGLRASDIKTRFSTDQLYVRAKQNYATRVADFVLQSVGKNTLRHETLQRFMIANDSVTVATEVPVYITQDDITHMQHRLGFDIPLPDNWKNKHATPRAQNGTLLITGHIDALQVRNGHVHILDFKPHADHEKPIEQLVWYALALSRLTGLRMYEFLCAWFDGKNYYEFFPLHTVYKKKGKKHAWNQQVKIGTVLDPAAMRPRHKTTP